VENYNAQQQSSLTKHVDALCDPVPYCLGKVLAGEITHTERAEEEVILPEENETENYIRSLDLDKLSPIEAINILYDLKNRL
jgi:hypothetical protein